MERSLTLRDGRLAEAVIGDGLPVAGPGVREQFAGVGCGGDGLSCICELSGISNKTRCMFFVAGWLQSCPVQLDRNRRVHRVDDGAERQNDTRPAHGQAEQGQGRESG